VERLEDGDELEGGFGGDRRGVIGAVGVEQHLGMAGGSW
jgi:hypothetical protein